MEYPFTHLVSTKITRLLRPRAALSVNLEHSLVPPTLETMAQESEETLCSNDISDSYSGFDNMFIFPTKFGKMYVGQTFRGIVNICNLSKAYPLTNVRIRGILSLQSRGNEPTNQMEFINANVGEIPPNSSWAPSVEIYIGEVDTYIILLEVNYGCESYKKDLERFPQPEKYATRTNTYEIQAGRNVMMHFLKKYRFESTLPFATTHKTCRTEDGGYLVQSVLESKILNPVYIEDVKILPFKNLEAVPMSKEYPRLMEEVFERSQSIRIEDKRSYTHFLRRTKEITPEDLLQYYKAGAIQLGNLQVVWINSFGERNVYYSNNILAPHAVSTEKFLVKLLNAPAQLYVEEPQSISLRITNMSPNAFRLKLYIKEEETKTIAINALSHQELGQVPAFRSFDIQILVYPKYSGIQRLAGLHAIDMIGKSDVNFGVLGEFLVVGRDTEGPLVPI